MLLFYHLTASSFLSRFSLKLVPMGDHKGSPLQTNGCLPPYRSWLVNFFIGCVRDKSAPTTSQ